MQSLYIHSFRDHVPGTKNSLYRTNIFLVHHHSLLAQYLIHHLWEFFSKFATSLQLGTKMNGLDFEV